ncbi:MAG: hypothetical protein KJZ65_01600 [Phycisphaerales bacterium]|nr:hypothetical protein [Phycisphaerales bacterium]
MAGCARLSAAAAMVLLAGAAWGSTWKVQLGNVMGEVDFQQIQQAIDSHLVVNGDTILVYGPGSSIATADPSQVYPEVLDLGVKNLVIRGAHGSTRVRIMALIPDPGMLPLQVVRIGGGQDRSTRLEHFSIETPQITTPDGVVKAPVRGMHIESSAPVIHDCLFVDLVAESGSGILVETGPDGLMRGNPMVQRCEFRNCDTLAELPARDIAAPLRGGAINVFNADLVLERTAISDCWAPVCGGALHVAGESNVMVRNSWFANNATDGLGGAIYTEHDGEHLLAVIESTFEDNRAELAGGAVAALSEGETYLLSCDFAGNEALSGVAETTSGGAVYHAEAMGPVEPSPSAICRVVNSRLYDNRAERGAAIAANHSAARTWVMDTTIAQNTAGAGHAALYYLAHLRIENSIVYHNQPAMWVESAGIGGPASAFYSDLEGYVGPDNTGCFDLPPQFMAMSTGDLRLRPSSPCVDAGDTARLPADRFDLDADGDVEEALPLDLDGGSRVYDDMLPGAVDMGCYEVREVGPCNLADWATPYWTLDFFDVLLFLQGFSQGVEQADLNGDGVLNFFDVLLFLQEFSAGCP